MATESITPIFLDSLGRESSSELSQFSDQIQLPSESPSEQLTEQFLNTLGDIKSDISDKANAIDVALSEKDLSPSQLLKVQYELMQVTMQQDLISKGVSKSTQNVDTLIKAQ